MLRDLLFGMGLQGLLAQLLGPRIFSTSVITTCCPIYSEEDVTPRGAMSLTSPALPGASPSPIRA